MSEYKLTSEILARSVAQNWDHAKLEWELEDISKEEEPSTCLCGHYPILELCTLRNRKNENTAVVGNCCVKKFMGLPSGKIFSAITRVEKKWSNSLNVETIEYAFSKGWINDWERNFYLDTRGMRIRSMSKKQNMKRFEINERILRHVVKRRGTSGATLTLGRIHPAAE